MSQINDLHCSGLPMSANMETAGLLCWPSVPAQPIVREAEIIALPSPGKQGLTTLGFDQRASENPVARQKSKSIL
jgi:hypothetical protein